MIAQKSIGNSIIVDNKKLRTIQRVNQLIRAMRDAELNEILEKEAERCRRLIQPQQD